MPNRLELRRNVRLTPRGGACSGRVELSFLPSSRSQAIEAFARARERVAEGSRAITLGGAERSFETHFLPRQDTPSGVLVSTKRLRGGVEVLGPKPSADGLLRVRALAGTSFAELLRAVHATGAEFMPFSCPTAEAISIGGALAANTHGRTSSTYGGLFAEHVRSFHLVAPDGRAYDCRADAEGELERALFRYVPGALGALGLVTDIELELCPVSPRTDVVVEVLEARRADPLPAVRSYLERVADNRKDSFQRFSEGLSLVFFGTLTRGTAVVLGRRRGSRSEPRRSTLPLFRDGAESNLFVQAFSHRFPRVAQALATRVLVPGRSFRAPYYRWAFFQSSYDEAAARLLRERPLVWDALGLASDLGLVHQAWVMNAASLAAFVALASEILERPEFAPLGEKLEFFDVLSLPEPRAPLDASRSLGGDAHVATLSIAVHDRAERELAEAYCKDLSGRAFERQLPLVVQLVKQHHVSSSILRAMHRTALDELAALKRRVDTDDVLGSRTLERLGF